MTQNRSTWSWRLWLGSSLAIFGAFTSFENYTFAQITPDSSLGTESSVVKPIAPLTNQIEGGAIRGTNLFHSFEQFSVPTNGEVSFNNSLNIQNIITRVTGSSTSDINGLIKAKGTANLFLINANGFIFGPNASLNIGGSFLASTASSLDFADGSRFSVTASQTTPLLTVSIPTGLQFGATPESIINRSQASLDGAINSVYLPAGLQVQKDKTLALVGGDVLLEGGNLTAEGGRIELGSVAGNSLVRLSPIEKGLSLSYEGVQSFQNIQLTPRTFNGSGISSYVDASGKGGGDIQLQGRLIRLTDSTLIARTSGELQPGNLTVNASELVELTGYITSLTTLTDGSGDGGNISINTEQLIVWDGAQVFTSTIGMGSGGHLTVNASDSVKLIGSFPSPLDNRGFYSGLSSATAGDGDAGDLTINTRRLIIQDGAKASTESNDRIDSFGQLIPATGQGGNLTVNASDSVELIRTNRSGSPSSLSTSTKGAGNAGNLTITTAKLTVQDGAVVNVSSQGTGDAGKLEVTANSIRLENGGKLIATSASGEGGNIRLSNLDLLLLRGNSEISTDATAGTGNGGNITIDTNLLAAVENSNITANAVEGRGGNIRITAQGIFLSPNSKITARSERGIDGIVEINRPDVDPTAELVVLPAEIVDVSELVAQGCPIGGGNLAQGSEFVVTGRGGLPPTPTEATRSDSVLADLGTPIQSQDNSASAAIRSNSTNSEELATVVEAQGWVIGSKGEVILTASAPIATPDIPWLTPTSCNGS